MPVEGADRDFGHFESATDSSSGAFLQEFISELGNDRRARNNIGVDANSNGLDNPVLNLPELELYDSADEKAQWTIAVDLTSDLILPDGTDVGAQNEFEKLQQLVESSKGNSDVAIAVQVADNPAGQLPLDGSGRQQNVNLDRYIIRDGQITKVETVDSEGMQANQTGLLKFAAEIAPSEHIGMIIQAHGGGANGLLGGTGRETLDQLSAAVQAGLEGSGHERLDVLDFDSCSMSSAAAVGAVANVADHVVVSELRERASKNFDGQNLNAFLSDLLQNPQTSPEDLGKMIVENANSGTSPEVLPGDPFKHVGADVLASIDSVQYGQFAQALDELGARLSDAAQDEQSRHVIEKLMDGTSRLPGDQNFVERRDLKEFVAALKAAAENGELPDGAAISRAATQVLDAQTNMTDAVNVSDSGGYDQLGGMYVFLPVQEVRDGTADGPNGLHWLEHKTTDADFAKKDQLVGVLEQASNNILDRLSERSQEQFAPVFAAIDTVRNAKSSADFTEAIRTLNNIVTGLKDTDVEKELRENLVQREDISMAENWNDFMHSFAP